MQGHHRRQQADRAGAVDGDVLTRLQRKAMHAVQRDGQRLRHRDDVPRHIIRHLEQHVRRVAEVFRHTAVHMHAEHLQIHAAVGSADGAGIAVTAVQIRIDNHVVAGLNAVLVILRNADDLARDFVADDAGIRNKAVRAAESADVAAADARGFHAQKRLARLRLRHLGITKTDVPRLLQINRFHCF